jgi:hypothetical protein
VLASERLGRGVESTGMEPGVEDLHHVHQRGERLGMPP